MGAKEHALLVQTSMDLQAGPDAIEVHVATLLVKTGVPQATAQQVAAGNAKKILQRLKNIHTSYAGIGRPLRYAFNDVNTDLIQGTCWIGSTDSAESIAAKNKRLHSEIYSPLLEQITYQEFEVLCAKVLGILGVLDPVVTSATRDDGVDFLGKISLRSSKAVFGVVTPTIEQQLHVWLVGQAKHFQRGQVGSPEVVPRT